MSVLFARKPGPLISFAPESHPTPQPQATQSAKSGLPTRMRRNRQFPWLRDLVREHTVTAADLVWPVFVREGQDIIEPIPSLPGVNRYSIDRLLAEVAAAKDLGIRAIAIFPVTPAERKDPFGQEALNPNNLVCTAARAIKDAMPDIGLIADVALDPYTTHGHDGLLQDGRILNDETVEILCQQAITQAEAGFDVIAPSDMMDGRVGAIRTALDGANMQHVCILSYAAKYASAFYGPFRDAVGSKGCLQGDKKTYQMDPANTDEALREVALDIAEGADMVMIKPGLPYLDIIRRVKDEFKMPTFAYHVSGEYAMVAAAAANGWLDGDRAMMEVMIAFKRAGADAILTYAARDIARALR